MPAKSAGRFIAAIAGGTALGQALVFATTPIISRLYSKADLGEFGLFLSFLSVASVAVTARYELAIPGARDDDEGASLLLIVMLAVLPISAVCAAGLWLMIASNLMSFGTLPLWTIVALIPALATFGAFMALRYWFVRTRRFGEIGRVLVAQGAGRASVPVLIGLFQPGPLGLIAGELAGRLLGVRQMLREAAAPLRAARRRRELWPVARANWKFPVLLMPSGLLDVLTLALPVPLVSRTFGIAAAGSFLVVQRLTTLPAALVASGVGDVFHVAIAEAMTADRDSARAKLERAAFRLLRVGSLILVPAAIVAPFLLPTFLGKDWGDSGLLFAAVAPWSLASLVVTPLSRVLLVAERKELKLAYDIAALVLLVGSISLGTELGLTFISTIVLASSGQVIGYALYFAILRAVCRPTMGSR